MQETVVISNDRDWTTYQVIDWLMFYGAKVYYQNIIDHDKNDISISLDQNYNKSFLKIDNKVIKPGTKFWLRKFPRYIYPKLLFGIDNVLIKSFVNEEREAFIKFYYSYHRNAFSHLGSNSQYNSPLQVNKLESLIQARNCGLNIPKSIVTNAKCDIKEFLDEVKTAIIKPLSEPTMLSNYDKIFTMHTKYFDLDYLNLMDDKFFPIYLQKYIPKEFEIRVFYLKNKFYSSAIYSQNDPQTKVDYRKYNNEVPNRVVPFKLPKSIVNKLLKLLILMGLNTASVDLIFTPNEEFYFLEINPVGQFGSLSLNCNYSLEDIIANSLIYG